MCSVDGRPVWNTASEMPMPLFDRSEFLNRVARTKREMERRGLDLLLIASPANQFYLTGYDGWSFYTPQMGIVSLDQEEPIWFGRKMDSVGAKFTAFMGPENIIPYADEYVGSSERHPMQYLAKILQERGWDKGRIGVEMEDYYYTARWHQILTSLLPNAEFVDAFLLVNRVRMTKSPQEIEFMMQAGAIGAMAMQAAYEKAAVGVRQSDVMAELYKVTIGGTPEFGGTFPCKPPNAMVNELCTAPHLSWTEEKLKDGDIFYIEQGGVRHRYHTPMSRCIYLGTPPAEMLRTVDIIKEGLEAVLDAVKPGILCQDLEAVWRKVIAKYGIEKDSRIGYPVGIGYPPTWGELTCSLRAGDETVMEENMTFHCIPALWLDKFGLVVSESFVVTPEGAKTFSNYPRKLLVK